jgi:hypothetical protein
VLACPAARRQHFIVAHSKTKNEYRFKSRS